jgi:hypothetical protein
MRKDTIQKLYDYADKVSNEWPIRNLPEPTAQVEKDTLQDWCKNTWYAVEWQSIIDENDHCLSVEEFAKRMNGEKSSYYHYIVSLNKQQKQ